VAGDVELNSHAEDKAEADLKTAISYAPQDPQAYLMMGEIRFAQKHYPEGAALFEKALQCDPNSVPPARTGRLRSDEEAAGPGPGSAERSDRQEPSNSGFLDLLAQLQIGNKNFDQAAVTAQKAIHVNPMTPRRCRSTLSFSCSADRREMPSAHGSNGRTLIRQCWSFRRDGTWRNRAETGSRPKTTTRRLFKFNRAAGGGNNLAYLMLEHGAMWTWP